MLSERSYSGDSLESRDEEEVLEQFIRIDPTNLTSEISKLLYKYIMTLDAEEILIQEGAFKEAETTHHFKLLFPVEIKRHDNQIVSLDVIEYIEPSNFFQNKPSEEDADYSFLTIKKVHGKLLINDDNCIYQANSKTTIVIKCRDLLDPQTPSKTHRYFLDYLFQCIYSEAINKNGIISIKNGYLSAGSQILELTMRQHIIIFDINLTLTIAMRASTRYPKKYRADVVDEKALLGSGSFAGVLSILGTFKDESFYPKPHRILKDYIINYKSGKEDIERRRCSPPVQILISQKVGQLIPYLNTSAPTEMETKTTIHYQTRENRVRGQSLEEILKQYSLQTTYLKKDKQLSIDEFLKILCNAALTLFKYYFLNRVVNRDIKPDNIYVDLEDFSVYLIDNNLSKMLGETHGDQHGTAKFISPEGRTGGVTTPKSDLYSLLVSMKLFF